MSGVRRILVDARTCLNYAMVAPVHALMMQDSRVQFSFVASEEPARARSIYRDAPPGARMIGPLRAALNRFDAYLTSDFMWASQPRGTCRIQMFHGVGGKYGFDAPTESMRQWDRLFFINRRRLANYVSRGAIDPDSPAIRLTGMPKADCIVDGTYRRDRVLESLGLDPGRPTVLYAPTRSPESSLNVMGAELIGAIARLGVNLIVKLHDRQRDLRVPFSGGVDWPARLQPLLDRRSVLAPGANIAPYLVAADVMITDHSSAGFEFLLCDRPLVRIHLPSLIERANIHPEYVDLLASASYSVRGVADATRAIERGLQEPRAHSPMRCAVARELFYGPGTATTRVVSQLYEAIELAEPAMSLAAQEDRCPLSA